MPRSLARRSHHSLSALPCSTTTADGDRATRARFCEEFWEARRRSSARNGFSGVSNTASGLAVTVSDCAEALRTKRACGDPGYLVVQREYTQAVSWLRCVEAWCWLLHRLLVAEDVRWPSTAVEVGVRGHSGRNKMLLQQPLGAVPAMNKAPAHPPHAHSLGECVARSHRATSTCSARTSPSRARRFLPHEGYARWHPALSLSHEHGAARYRRTWHPSPLSCAGTAP